MEGEFWGKLVVNVYAFTCIRVVVSRCVSFKLPLMPRVLKIDVKLVVWNARFIKNFEILLLYALLS